MQQPAHKDRLEKKSHAEFLAAAPLELIHLIHSLGLAAFNNSALLLFTSLSVVSLCWFLPDKLISHCIYTRLRSCLVISYTTQEDLYLLWCFLSKTNKPWLIRVRLPSLKDQRTLSRRRSREKKLIFRYLRIIHSCWKTEAFSTCQDPHGKIPQVWERQGCLYSTEGCRGAEELWRHVETAENSVLPARSPHPFSHCATGQLWVGSSAQAVAHEYRDTKNLCIFSGLPIPGRTPQSPTSSLQTPNSCQSQRWDLIACGYIHRLLVIQTGSSKVSLRHV